MKMLAKCGEGTRIFVRPKSVEMLDNEASQGAKALISAVTDVGLGESLWHEFGSEVSFLFGCSIIREIRVERVSGIWRIWCFAVFKALETVPSEALR